MNTGDLKNIVVIKDLPSNLIEEAIANKIDTNNITEYGIKIVMDEEKIIREGKYTFPFGVKCGPYRLWSS